MNRQRQMRMAPFLALVALAAHPIAVNTQVASPAAVAAKASPELVTALSKEMGSTPEQSAGAAGALTSELACPIPAPFHIFLWHILPVVVAAGIGALVGSLLLERLLRG